MTLHHGLFGDGDHLMLAIVKKSDTNHMVLVVKDTSKPSPLFKFPGGGRLPGENVLQAVCRETLEETGISVPCEDVVYLGSTTGYNRATGETYEITFSTVLLDYYRVDSELARETLYEGCMRADLLPVPLDGSGTEFLAVHKNRLEKVKPDLARILFW